MDKPRVFISHCQSNMDATDYAIRIINALGCTPVIAEFHPKQSKSVHLVVRDSMNSCVAVVVIATPDLLNGNNYSPSSGVSEELGILKSSEKWNNKYFIIKEETVVLSAMSPEARYTFKKDDFAEIAFAIIVELGAMNVFKNYYELNGSDLQMHELLDTFHQLNSLHTKGVMSEEDVKKAVEQCATQIVNTIVSKSNGSKN